MMWRSSRRDATSDSNLLGVNWASVPTCRSFETQLSRVEAELLRREAPPSYGQLIAQGLIPPVEDFPVCSGNQVQQPGHMTCSVT